MKTVHVVRGQFLEVRSLLPLWVLEIELRLVCAYQLSAQQALLLTELFYSVINFTNPLSSPLSLLKQLPQHREHYNAQLTLILHIHDGDFKASVKLLVLIWLGLFFLYSVTFL